MANFATFGLFFYKNIYTIMYIILYLISHTYTYDEKNVKRYLLQINPTPPHTTIKSAIFRRRAKNGVRVSASRLSCESPVLPIEKGRRELREESPSCRRSRTR